MIKTLQVRLREELQYRSRRLIVPHLLLVALSMYMLRGFPNQAPFFLIIGALVIRKYVFNLRYVFLFVIFLAGAGWSFLAWEVSSYFGAYSTESLYCIACSLMVMSSGITVFSSWLLAAITFQVAVGLGPILIFILDPGKSSHILGILLCMTLIYQFYHSYISNQFIIKSLINEIAVKKQNTTLQEFIDSIPGLVTVIDQDLKFYMVNNYLNGSLRNIVGTNLSAFYPSSDLTQSLLSFMQSGKPSHVCEVKFDDLGEENWYVVNLSRISSPENSIIAAMLPITDLVKAKNDLKIQEARSLYAAKLASLGEVSAGIAHEVNNPLTIIEGAGNLMKVLLAEESIDREALQKVNAKIMDTTGRIAKIIKSLRTLALNAEVDPFKNISFQAIIEPTLEISKPKLVEHEIELRVTCPEVDVQLFGNEIQLSQVIMNLVTNAIDAVKDCRGPRWIEIKYLPTLEWQDIFIIDNGVGVAQEYREKIMEAFFTTKDSDKGTGLGLSISKNIVHSHHGSLELLAGEKHTTFRIRFPRMTVWQPSRRKIHQEEKNADQ